MSKLSRFWSLIRVASPLAKGVLLYRLWRWNRARRLGKPEGSNEALVNLMLASVPFLRGRTGLLLSILPAVSPIIEGVTKQHKSKTSSFISRRSS
jgi:hypothetical protein